MSVGADYSTLNGQWAAMRAVEAERDALAALVAEQCDQIMKLHALARYVRTGQDYAGAVAAMKRVFGDSLR